MEKLTNIDFALGPGGWVKTWWRRDGRERTAWIRFEERTRRRLTEWVIVELRMKDPTAESLREIPLHRIARSFNTLEISETLRDHQDEEVPDDLDSAIRELFRAKPRKKLKRPAGRKLDDDFFRRSRSPTATRQCGDSTRCRRSPTTLGRRTRTVARWVAQSTGARIPAAEPGK